MENKKEQSHCNCWCDCKCFESQGGNNDWVCPNAKNAYSSCQECCEGCQCTTCLCESQETEENKKCACTQGCCKA